MAKLLLPASLQFCGAGAVAPATEASRGGNLYTALFGPRASVSVHGIRPFAHVLFGLMATGGLGSDVSFASAYGGGVDFKIAPIIGWRLQGDYIHTTLEGGSQGHGRLSTGIVLRF